MQSEPHGARTMVWALPRSLAATCGIVITFSSSGYLDVSVHRVPSVWLWIYHTVTGCASRVPPFRHLRINAYVQLPAAFRSLSRLSSALSAKASALRPLLLNHCSRISLLIRLVLFYPAWRFILDESNFLFFRTLLAFKLNNIVFLKYLLTDNTSFLYHSARLS